MNYDPDGNPITMAEWLAISMDEGEKRVGEKRVAFTEVGGIKISTVWIGFDYSFGAGVPLIYESMVFGGPLDETQWRYPNRVAALAGHDQLVAHVRDEATADITLPDV